jgi:hypothetical protein
LDTPKKSELIHSVDLKLRRAQSQFIDLLQTIHKWTDANEFTVHCELREGRLGYRLIQNDFKEPVPVDDWGLAIGEYIHNIRSALDNLAFALARLKKDPPDNPNMISFPIYQDKAQFEINSKKSLSQMSDDAAEQISLLQPFQRTGTSDWGLPENDPLLLIQWLNNSDKHRIPSIVLLAPIEIAHSVTVEFQKEEDAFANVPPDTTIWGGPMFPGAVLLEHRTKHPIASVKGIFNGKVAVAFQTNKEPLPVDEVIPKLGYYVDLVVSQFRPFFIETE